MFSYFTNVLLADYDNLSVWSSLAAELTEILLTKTENRITILTRNYILIRLMANICIFQFHSKYQRRLKYVCPLFTRCFNIFFFFLSSYNEIFNNYYYSQNVKRISSKRVVSFYLEFNSNKNIQWQVERLIKNHFNLSSLKLRRNICINFSQKLTCFPVLPLLNF